MAMSELAKVYDPTDIEQKWYSNWEKAGVFKPNEDSNEPFTLMIPPPNVTGILTMGHVLNNTIQDVLVRRARMQGKSTLWLPGTDHASIATEAKVTRMLKDDGIDKREIGRDEFLKHAWKWKEKYGGIIIKQLKNLGCSCEWDREVFTMDDGYSNAVLEVFVKLYKDGLIYKGERIINWDPVGQTALSDEEVIYKESKGKLWHFRYPITGTDNYLVVATTRPETMLGDTGIAVNPKDERYTDLVGKTVTLPIVNRDIPIFADNYVDMEFGTGCVKVTPAHDPNDFDMGERNNLDIINVMHPNATMNENTPKQYQNLDRYEARKLVLQELDALGYLDKIEDYDNKVGHSERTDAVVEPYLSNQWFLKMEPLAKPALKAVNEGQINFYPERWIKTYNHWLENVRDWCISRQLWWGHRIPVWYKGDEIYCGLKAPQGDGWVQDEDVLDTWFSSWLWPFATLGWPKNTDDLQKFYPTQDLVTGPDIIFFWVARMIMAGLYFMDDIPFSNVYFTGIIRDSEGRKMSKSLGNSPDPLDLFEKYGADAVRVSVLMIAPQGLDILFTEERLEQGRNFMNKLWNSARFVMMNLDDELPQPLSELDNALFDPTDKWILSKLNKTIQNVDEAYTQYKLNDAVKQVYNFVWGDFCNWYIEFCKARFYSDNVKSRQTAQTVSVHIIRNILKLLHPYTPHITEELWSYFSTNNEEMIAEGSWPSVDTSKIDNTVESEIQLIMDIITSVRNMRVGLNIAPSKKATLLVRGKQDVLAIVENHKSYLDRLANIDNLSAGVDIEKPEQSATSVVQKLELFIPLAGLIDVSKEIDRLEKQISDMEGRLRAVNGKLSNENFVARAPKQVVEHEQKKQADYQESLEKLQDNLTSLKS
jgi:valyl-tRNA synthetase